MRWWVEMVVRLVCVIRVPSARVCNVLCVPIPANGPGLPPVSFNRYGRSPLYRSGL